MRLGDMGLWDVRHSRDMDWGGAIKVWGLGGVRYMERVNCVMGIGAVMKIYHMMGYC